jgi:hypothetical protein
MYDDPGVGAVDVFAMKVLFLISAVNVPLKPEYT